MKIETLEDLFVEQLCDIHFAETKLTKALPQMAKHATDPKLKQGFEKHLKETNDQIAKIERVMASLGLKVKSEKCEAILGLIKEADDLIAHIKDKEVLDAALVLAAQKVEHYEIATYGSLCAIARRLGYDAEAEILHSILEQEKATDEALTKLAESAPGLNQRAKAA